MYNFKWKYFLNNICIKEMNQSFVSLLILDNHSKYFVTGVLPLDSSSAFVDFCLVARLEAWMF